MYALNAIKPWGGVVARSEQTVVITSPLETEHVARLRDSAPAGVTFIHHPDILPPMRYVADHKGRDGWSRTADQQARWVASLGQATILWDFPAGDTEQGGGLALAPNVKWVQTTSSGVGQLVANYGLAETDITITTARGIHAIPLAEFVMMSVLVHRRELFRLQKEQRARQWDRYCGSDLPGRVMVIIGAGKVGAEVGRLARAFGMKVIAVVRNAAPARAAALNADEVHGPETMAEAVARADCVTICTPHTPETENMVNADLLARMKPGVTIVNIGRGAVLDELALIAALKSGHIGFAALDVAATEPLPQSSPLWDMPNVLISPHSASTVMRENERLTDIFLHNLTSWMAGDTATMMNVLDKKRMY